MTDVDIIECVRRPRPVTFRVIDLEFEVRGHPTGLDRAQVGPNDLRGGVSPVESE